MTTRSFRCHEKAMILLCVFNFTTKVNASAPAVYRERRESRARPRSQDGSHRDLVRVCDRRPSIPRSPTQRDLGAEIEFDEVSSSPPLTPQDENIIPNTRARARVITYQDLPPASDNEEEECNPPPQYPEHLRRSPGSARSVSGEEKTNLRPMVRRQPEDAQKLHSDLLGHVSGFLSKEEIGKNPGLLRANRARAGTVWGSQWPNEKKLDYILANEKMKNFLLRDPSHGCDDRLYMLWYSSDHEITQKGILVDTWVDWLCTRRCRYTRRTDSYISVPGEGTAKLPEIQFYRYHDDGPMENYWEKIDPQGPNLIDYWNYAENRSTKMDRDAIDREKRDMFENFHLGKYKMGHRVEP